MGNKNNILFAFICAFFYALGELFYAQLDLSAFMRQHSLTWISIGFAAPYCTTLLVQAFLVERIFKSQKGKVFQGLFVYTLIGMTVTTLGVFLANIYLDVRDSSLLWTFFSYIPVKFFEGTFYFLFAAVFAFSDKENE